MKYKGNAETKMLEAKNSIELLIRDIDRNKFDVKIFRVGLENIQKDIDKALFFINL